MKAMALAAMAVWLAGAGAARGAEGPREIEIGKGVDGRLAGGGLDCYQVDAPKGKLAVSIKDAAFTPVVQLLRGVRCDAEVRNMRRRARPAGPSCRSPASAGATWWSCAARAREPAAIT